MRSQCAAVPPVIRILESSRRPGLPPALRLHMSARFYIFCTLAAHEPSRSGIVWHGVRLRPELGQRSLLLAMHTGDADIDARGEKCVVPEPLLDLWVVARSFDFHEHRRAILEDKQVRQPTPVAR